MGIVHAGVLLLKVILVFFLHTNSTIFTEANRDLSKDEYLSMKRHLKSLNKPAVKSIETEYGDIFDCVDINKQHAFDHPLLKNHTVQMKPSSCPKRKDDKIFSNSILDIGLTGEGCPVGTVPIRRVTMEDLMRAPSLSHFGKKYVLNDSRITLSNVDFPYVHHWAVVQANGGEFYGTQAAMNLWQPHVDSQEFSLAQFWLTGGPQDRLNTIEAGWIVMPSLFKDNNVHLFAYWTADGYQSTGCYNAVCPGFVQVSRKIPLGAGMRPVSIYGGKQFEITLLAFKDIRTKNWWLRFGNELVGYWPSKLFNSLSTRAENVHWGGEVANPENFNWPRMGSGHFGNEGHGKASYMRELLVVTEDNAFADAPDQIAFYHDAPKCYSVVDLGRLQGDWRTIYFGGPGGNCN